MTGLRTYTTLDPNIWRFPQWKEDVYYPAGSFVGVAVYNPVDSEQVTFAYYVATQDVTLNHVTAGAPVYRKGELAPNDSDSDWLNHTSYASNPWSLAFDTTADVLNNQLLLDVLALQPLLALLGVDSDINVLYQQDSDSVVKDSELDSDIRMEIHDRKAADSDIHEMLIRLDSELDSEIHDRMAADSDIHEMLIRLDSELDSEIHDRMAADSDIYLRLDSEYHDRKADDSDIRLDLDSDILRVSISLDSDSDRLRNFIHRYYERDSDIQTVLNNHDSDINWLYANGGAGGTALGNTGFPVGTILAFATTEMPTGFYLCDGRTFDALAYPDLLTMLGTNRVPDLRNQFLRGYNNDSDGYGNARAMLSRQTDAFKSHTHTTRYNYERYNTDGPSNATGGDGSSAGSNQINATGGNETRPVNTMVAFGIALYNGAGIIYDSEVVESILRMRLRDYDSDLIALYNRTNFRSVTFAPVVDQPVGTTYNIGENISNYDDVEVMLNGVSVTQYTTATSVFTFNFIIRGNIDIVTIKLRR